MMDKNEQKQAETAETKMEEMQVDNDEQGTSAHNGAGEAESTGTEPQTADEGPNEIIARLEAEVAEAQNKVEQYVDQMQRTAAEFQNARRRQERQLQESIDRATENFVRRLLPVLDDFDLAFKNVPGSLSDEESAWIQGFQRIQQKLSTLLTDEGVTPIAQDGEFDPNQHEAVTNEPNDSVDSGHIIETLRIGYAYKDKVLRPALVRVAQ